MKVKELIEILQEYDPEMEVHTSYGYGDYWHTQVAPKVGYVEEGKVEYSEYHRMDRLVETDGYYDDEEEAEEEQEPKEPLRRVVVIG
jgi:hypothetical protein